MYTITRSLVCLVIFIFLWLPAHSQTHAYGAWGIATFIIPSDTSHRFGMYAEGKVQTNEISFDNYYHNEVKAGLSYALSNTYTFLVGAGRYTTFHPDNIPDSVIIEDRIFEQLSFTSNLGRLLFDHRYRVEQRWINDAFRTSFRYKANIILPINHKKLRSGTLFLSAFDEISLGLKAYSFERNRMSASLGMQFSKSFTMLAGIINEDNESHASHLEKNNLLVNLIYQVQRPKKTQTQKPN
jgi:hypothetical protein